MGEGVMKSLRVIAVTAALSLGLLAAQPSFAQDQPSPQAMEAARSLTSAISIVMVGELTTSLSNQVWPGLEAAVRRHNPAISAATLAELRRELEQQQVAIILSSMNDAAAIYARHFTIQEMSEMAAFYQTPAGRKALTVMPKLMTEFVSVLAPRLQTLEARAALLVANVLQGQEAVRPPSGNASHAK